MRAVFKSLALAAGLGGAALADPISYKEAREAVPVSDRVSAVLYAQPFLARKERDIVTALKDSIPYYGALALSPDEGLYVDWLNASGQYHSRASARRAALAHCEKNRKPESAECVIVLEVIPAGDREEAALTLSAPAGQALQSEYRRLATPRAFAISPETGSFGFAEGSGTEAITACASGAGAPGDCTIVIAD